MSEILVNKLTGKTSAGDITVTSEGGAATMQLQQGLAKTWAHLDLKTENSIDDSLNVSSISDVATGQVSVTASNAMATINYTCNGNAWNGTPTSYDRVVTPYRSRTTTAVYLAIALTATHGLEDCQDVDVLSHGDLA
jgi:CRISPR/Cas system CMR-associated protein Cmr5 small subunit